MKISYLVITNNLNCHEIFETNLCDAIDKAISLYKGNVKRVVKNLNNQQAGILT